MRIQLANASDPTSTGTGSALRRFTGTAVVSSFLGGRGLRTWGLVAVLFLLAVAQAQAGTLYMINNASDRLGRLDTNNLGAGIQDVGPLGTDQEFGGLAYDSNTGTMYMVGGRANNNVWTVNPNTGQATLVGPHGQTDLFGATFDTTNNVLYGSQFLANTPLHDLSITNGSSTPIGNITPRIGGLAYDSLRDELLGTSAGAGDLFRIDRATGDTTLLNDGGFFDNGGLAYDAMNDLLWNLDFGGNLISFDPTQGYARTQEASGLGTEWTGMAWVVPEPGTGLLLMTGLLGLGINGRSRRASRKAISG